MSAYERDFDGWAMEQAALDLFPRDTSWTLEQMLDKEYSPQ